VALARQHSGKTGDHQRSGRRDLRAFAGADSFDVEENDENTDQAEGQQSEWIIHKSANAAKKRRKGERSEARFLSTTLALDSNEQPDSARERESGQRGRIGPRDRVVSHSTQCILHNQLPPATYACGANGGDDRGETAGHGSHCCEPPGKTRQPATSKAVSKVHVEVAASGISRRRSNSSRTMAPICRVCRRKNSLAGGVKQMRRK
jgi:hypothetical protein